MSFDLSDYTTVAERLEHGFERYPDCRFQSELDEVRSPAGDLIGWKCRVAFWRTPEDPLPIIAHAVEPVPGTTPYTRNSEAMNAETSAIGRALILAGFPSKKIASADEVLARQASAGAPPPTPPSSPPTASGTSAADSGASPAEQIVGAAREAQQRQQHPSGTPTDDGSPENVQITFGKHRGKSLGELPSGYLEWLVSNFTAKNAEQTRILTAAQEMLGMNPLSIPDDDIPF